MTELLLRSGECGRGIQTPEAHRFDRQHPHTIRRWVVGQSRLTVPPKCLIFGLLGPDRLHISRQLAQGLDFLCKKFNTACFAVNVMGIGGFPAICASMPFFLNAPSFLDPFVAVDEQSDSVVQKSNESEIG